MIGLCNRSAACVAGAGSKATTPCSPRTPASSVGCHRTAWRRWRSPSCGPLGAVPGCLNLAECAMPCRRRECGRCAAVACRYSCCVVLQNGLTNGLGFFGRC
ncbi:unnamed protein product [Symbiodinium necroappetens]|uniref:Uncharacterized protein n=1 Tax=Symbiodinium necroappetens TaxID=1628268 RepID=A0A812U3A2_9DINO|nr:unnamed protein product [Symbiodinium necroappetens]